MQSRRFQKGLTIWQLAYVLGSLGIFGIVGAKALPLYLDHLKVKRAVSQTASEGNSDPAAVISELYRRWAIEDIQFLEPKQIRIARINDGAALTYDYEAKVELFGNASLVFHYVGSHRIAPGG